MHKRLLILVFALIILVGFLHQIGSMFYFYWDSVWFDGFMHFLGALSMGVLFLWIWYVSGMFDISVPSKREAMASVIAFVLLVGIGWELFEFAHGIANPTGGDYWVDTFNDLVFDFIGGVGAGLIGRFKALYV